MNDVIAEEKRLAELHSLRLLDSGGHERFDRLTRIAQRLFDVPVALVSLVDKDRLWYLSKQGTDSSEVNRSGTFCERAILEEKPLVVEDAKHDHRFKGFTDLIESNNIRFYAGCPLKSHNGYVIGTLCVLDDKPRVICGNDIAILTDLAKMVESELHALSLATFDELTGLLNRRGFLEIANYTIKLADRTGRGAALLFIDLDGFKPINDNFGHAEGDRALITFSNIMVECFRDIDVLARMGGDEFVVLMTNTDIEDADIIIDRFNDRLRSKNAEICNYDIQFSHGLIKYDPSNPMQLDSLLSQGDSLMYKHKEKKHKGR